MPRDHNKRKINEAEAELVTQIYSLGSKARYGGDPIRIMNSAWFKRRNASHRSYRSCDCTLLSNNSRIVNQNAYHLAQIVDICHQLAHLLTGYTHDVDFVKAYLEVVQFVYGIEMRRYFKRRLVMRNVRTKVVSEETRKKMSDAWVKRNIDPDAARESLTRIMKELQGGNYDDGDA